MQNYFGIGLDAKFCLKFDQYRKKYPTLFKYRVYTMTSHSLIITLLLYIYILSLRIILVPFTEINIFYNYC